MPAELYQTSVRLDCCDSCGHSLFVVDLIDCKLTKGMMMMVMVLVMLYQQRCTWDLSVKLCLLHLLRLSPASLITLGTLRQSVICCLPTTFQGPKAFISSRMPACAVKGQSGYSRARTTQMPTMKPQRQLGLHLHNMQGMQPTHC